MAADAGRSPLDVLDDFRSFYFDTALSSSPAALPTLLAFARPGQVLFGSDWPFAPTPAGQYFANGLETYTALDADARAAIDSASAETLFTRYGPTPGPQPRSTPADRVRRNVQHAAARAVFRLVQPR